MLSQYKMESSVSCGRTRISLFNILSGLIVAVFFILFLQTSAIAQEAPMDETAPAETAILVEDVGSLVQSPEVLLDEVVSIEDMGANRARILPDSPWHVLKRVGWGLQEAFTFDTVKDAALKHEHANQQLAEVKQLIEEKGIDGVAPETLEKAIHLFENKMDDVANTTEKLKQEKSSNPVAIDNFFNDIADKQFKRQKFLSNLGQDFLKQKKEAQVLEDGTSSVDTEAVERILGTIQQSSDNSLGNVTQVLVGVSDKPEDVGSKLLAVLDAQEGSEFIDIKNLEFLEAIKQKVSDNVKDAIEQAKKDTLIRFEEKIKSIPVAVRAQKFEDYVRDTTASETKLFKLLEDIKQNANIPSDILSKIEQAKEIVVGRFEEKMFLIDNPDLEARFVRDFNPQQVDDLMMLEEFKQRMRPDSESLKIIEQEHQAGVDAFKKKFTDAQSQEQAKLFEKLSKELASNPTAKTFKLLRELEQGVLSDPTKRAFLEKMENDMKSKVEERFRREGDIYADRFASLDPEDMAIFDNIDFDDTFRDSLYTKSADKLKQHIGGIERPEEFDRFYDRFYDAPEVVINKIKEYDPEFQGAMQFKVRKIEEERANRDRKISGAVLDYEEREISFQMDRLQRQTEEEFWNKLNQIPWEKFAERKVLWQEKIGSQIALAEERYNEQKRIFEARIANDPWCDEVCRQIQLQSIEQQLRHEKQRLADDLVRERNRIESEKSQFNENNPLVGKCSTPQECEQFCKNNSNLPECGWVTHETEFVDCGPPPAYWDAGLKKCFNPQDQATQCGAGFYWDFKAVECVADPYYRPPETLRKCPWGEKWNENRGVCERTVVNCAPYPGLDGQLIYPPECARPEIGFCQPGFFWDDGRRDCVSTAQTQCPPNFYFDFYTKKCETEREIVCKPGENWDEGRQRCVFQYVECLSFDVAPCPAGQFREHYQNEKGCWVPGECRQQQDTCPKAPPACPAGEYRQTFLGRNNCTEYRPCEKRQTVCPAFDILPCLEGYRRDFYSTPEGCQMPGECRKVDEPKSVGFCGDGRCEGSETKYSCAEDCGSPNFCGNNICDNGETSASCPTDCKQTTGYCGDKKCDANESKTSCPVDCGYTTTCATGQTTCDYSACPNGCNWDTSGCVTGCWEGGVETCGNGYCGPGETLESCPVDCKGGELQYCDGICGNGESPTQCPGDCPTMPPGQVCGTNTCSSGSYCANAERGWCCPNNQVACGDGRCVNNDSECKIGYCGDGQCLGIETPAVCPSDCGAVAGDCSINFANNYNGSKTCNKTNCPNGCQYNAEGCPTECLAVGVTEYCGDGKCGSKESYSTCPLDCKTAGCGDGVCASGETTTSCPSDCKPATIIPTTPTTGYCGDGACGGSESMISCPADCKSTGATNTSCTTGKTTCDYTACPNGCNWDTNGCVSGCWSMQVSCQNMNGWHYESSTNTCVKDGVTCSTPTACSACPSGSGTSGSWCNYNNDGCPTGCQTSSSGGGGSMTSCTTGNTTCDYTACPSGCNWDTNGCVSGCQTTSGGGGSMTSCTTGNTTCDYTACPSGCNWDTNGCVTGCWTSSGGSGGGSGSGGWCGDYVCNNGETSTSCPSDCGGGSTSQYCDGICGNGESSSQCPGDCSGSGGSSSSCSSTPSSCATEAECTSYNFVWCGGGCYSNSSMCPTSLLNVNDAVAWQNLHPLRKVAGLFKSILSTMFLFSANAANLFGL